MAPACHLSAVICHVTSCVCHLSPVCHLRTPGKTFLLSSVTVCPVKKSADVQGYMIAQLNNNIGIYASVYLIATKVLLFYACPALSS